MSEIFEKIIDNISSKTVIKYKKEPMMRINLLGENNSTLYITKTRALRINEFIKNGMTNFILSDEFYKYSYRTLDITCQTKFEYLYLSNIKHVFSHALQSITEEEIWPIITEYSNVPKEKSDL